MDINQNKKTIKILLAENDEMMRIYFRDIFWVHGGDGDYEVETASSLEEAEQKILNKETRPDMIFFDVLINSVSGNNSPQEQMKRSLSFIKKIKENKEFSPIKIIVLSGHKEKFIEDITKQAKVDGYLIKGELMPKEIITFTEKIHESNN